MPNSGYFASITIDDGTELPAYNGGYFVGLSTTDGTQSIKWNSGYMASLRVGDAIQTPAYNSGYMVSTSIKEAVETNSLTFTFLLTNITSIVPEPAPLPGAVTINGTMLDKVTTVWMDGKRASWRLISDTQIYATIPIGITSTTVEVYLDYEF